MTRGQYRTGDWAGIWLAFSVALALHLAFLFLPIAGKHQPAQYLQRPVEIELVAVKKQLPATVSLEPETEPDSPKPEVMQSPDALPPSSKNPPESLTESLPANPLPPHASLETPSLDFKRDLDSMSKVEKMLLTSMILARQYITEESAVDRLFGKPLARNRSDFQKDFHHPLRKDLIEMLDQPLPDLPFEYTPGLIYFAYDPGLKGGLQRFWDVITPEFGWRTKYGTEVKCALILIIPGCVWK